MADAPTYDEYFAKARSLYPQATDAQIQEAYQTKYGGFFNPVRTAGPSPEVFAQNARKLYPNVTQDQIDQAYETKYGAGFLNETKRTLLGGVGAPMLQGTGAIVGGLGNLVDQAGQLFGMQEPSQPGAIQDLGYQLFHQGEQLAAQNAPSVELQHQGNLNPNKLTQNVIGGLGWIVPTIATGGAALAPMVASDAGQVAAELEAKGYSPEEARNRATAYAVGETALMETGLGRLFGRLPGRLAAGAGAATAMTGVHMARQGALGENPLANPLDTLTGTALPMALIGAALAPGGKPASERGGMSAEDQFRQNAGLENVPRGTDQPTVEPQADIAAQVSEIGQSRRGVYLAPGQPGNFEGIKVPVPGGGELLVKTPADAQEALLRFQNEPRQAVLGDFTGAGTGKPTGTDVVVQAVKDGKVIRESVVAPEEAQARAAAMQRELGVPVRITTAQEALSRRNDLLNAEGLSQEPTLPQGGIDRNRRQEAPGASPEGAGAVEYNPPTDLRSLPRGRYEPQVGDVVNLSHPVKVGGDGVIPPVPPDRTPDVTLDIPKTAKDYQAIRKMERTIPNAGRLDLAAQARDAQAFLPEFTQKLEGIAQAVTGNGKSVYGEFQPGALVAPVKSAGKDGWARVVEKVVTEEGGNTTLKDFGRATILVRNRAEAQAALDGVLREFGQAKGTSIRRSLLDAKSLEDVHGMDPYGYADVKVNVPGPNGRVYEVQITTPELFKTKETTGHSFYEEGRVREGKIAQSFQKVIGRRMQDAQEIKRATDAGLKMFRSRDAEMQRLYAESKRTYAGPLEDFFRASTSESNSASEISRPSALTDEGVTAANASPTHLAATGPLTMAGAPSTTKNLASDAIPFTSEASVAGQSQGSNQTRTMSVPGSNRRFEVRSEIVPLSELMASDHPGYDQRKQPRDRNGRAALQLQAEDIAANLDPNLLQESRSTADGAPVVGPDNMVESGNGRVMAMRLAQQKYPERWQAYQDALRAEGYNITSPDQVLVQRRVTPMTDSEVISYTHEANARPNAAMSATEQARSDAGLLNESVLTSLASGDMSQAQNVQAISQFFDQLPMSERNGLVDAKGKVTPAGERRAEAAMVAKAYGNAHGIDTLLDRLYETTDEGVRTVTNGLKLAAAKMAELRLALDTGRVAPEYDIAQDVINAYNTVREGKSRGMSGTDFLHQRDMTASTYQDEVLRMFFKPDGKPQNQDTIAAQLIYYAQNAAHQRMDQAGLFGEGSLVSPAEILKQAVDLIGDPHPTETNPTDKFARQGAKAGGMQSWGVRMAVDPIMRNWNPLIAPRVSIVQSPGELPTEILKALGPDIRGATDTVTGRVYLVADHIPDSWTAERILVHEAVGHYGFDRLFGDRFAGMVDQINQLATKDATIRRIGETVDRNYPNLDRPTRASEIIAHLAETQPKHPLARKIIAQFRELLRKLGFKVNLSKNDLVHLIRRSADAMQDRNPVQRDMMARQPKPSSYEPSRGAMVQTETPEFRAWFGNSRVVEPDGTPQMVFHGTTHDFSAFEAGKKANPENYHGKGFYFTTNPNDVGSNYATNVGPDIRSRIADRAEKIYDARMWKLAQAAAKRSAGGDPHAAYSAINHGPVGKRVWEESKAKAEKEIAGPHEGVTMPVYLSIKNPVKINEPGGTRWDNDLEHYNEKTDEYTENRRSEAAKLLKAVQQVAGDKAAEAVTSRLYDYGEISAKDLEQIFRSSDQEALYDYEGRTGRGPGAALQAIYRKLGFDGIRLDAKETFAGMSNVAHGTQHWVAFSPTQIKSAIGNRGTFDAKNPDILAARNEQVRPKAVMGKRIVQEAVNEKGDVLTLQVSDSGEHAAIYYHNFAKKLLRSPKETQNSYLLDSGPVDYVERSWQKRIREHGLTDVRRVTDQQGRPIPEGQGDMFSQPEQAAPKPAQTPDFNLEAPAGQVNTPAQGRLFASRATTADGMDIPRADTGAPAPEQKDRLGPVEVGGGRYEARQFGQLSQPEINVLNSVIGELGPAVAHERRGTRTWDATEQAAIDLVEKKYGFTLNNLVNRKEGSTANAEQLEAYGMMIGQTTQAIRDLTEGFGRNPSSEDMARLADLKERLGMLLAPAMGYQTEAGRALNILRKVSGELRNADDILAAMGDGTEATLKDFAHRVRNAESMDQAIGLTIAAYKPTLWDKFYEYWVNGLLSGPTTHAKNILSNTLFQVMESAAEVAAAPFSKDVSMRAALARIAAIPHGVTLGMANAKTSFLEERAVLTANDKLEAHRRAIQGKKGDVIRLPGRLLTAEDEFFKAIAYQGELASMAMEEAIRTNPQDVHGEFNRIMGSVLERPDMIKAAKKEAARVTFTTPLGPHMTAFQHALQSSRFGRLIIPFVRTPTNILLEATRFTPGAPLLKDVRNQLSNGGRDAALGWARMAVGTALMTAFAGMSSKGILSGAGPDDDSTRQQLYRQGWRPYSVKLPNGSWLKYNQFEPFGMLVGLAADLFEIGSSMKSGDYSAVGSMLMTSLASNLGDKTFLRGITEFSQAYADPKRYLSRWAMSLAASPVPNILGQTARWMDPYQRQANTLMDQYRVRIPGMSDKLAQRLDFAGEPIQRDTSFPGNPFQTGENKNDPLAHAMVTLGVRKNAPGPNISIQGQSFQLQGELFNSYKGYVQRARYQVLTPLVNSPQFRQMMAQNPMQAQAYLEQAWDRIGSQARLSWLFQNASALGKPKQAPGGRDLASAYALN